MRQIRGRKALVTGAASGIGRAIALRLAAEGADLFLVDIDQEGLDATVNEARQANVEVIGYVCDVRQATEVSAAVGELLSRWNGIDILVNNAGIAYYGRTDRMTNDHWEQVMRINLLSHVQFTRELLPALLTRREAHILNVCSVLGLVGMPKVAAYCASKFAMVGFSESLRAEYGRLGLGVTALCPGFVRTNLFASATVEINTSSLKDPPAAICTTPEKVAHAALKAIYRNKRLVVVEPFARVVFAVKRFLPGLIDRLLHLGAKKRTERKLALLEAGAISYGIPPTSSTPPESSAPAAQDRAA